MKAEWEKMLGREVEKRSLARRREGEKVVEGEMKERERARGGGGLEKSTEELRQPKTDV